MLSPLNHYESNDQDAGYRPRPRKKVNAEIDLIVADPAIARDAETLGNLRNLFRRDLLRRGAHTPASPASTLYGSSQAYRRYRGSSFPMQTIAGRQVEPWGRLTAWMKAQVAALHLGEGSFALFNLEVHSGVAAELKERGEAQQVYIRNRLARCLRARFGYVPEFFFVMEDRDIKGRVIKAHAHGCIAIPEVEPCRLKDGSLSMKTRIAIAREGIRPVRLAEGRRAMRAVLREVAQISGARARVDEGDQCRNVWLSQPRFPLFNHPWVSYAFKNVFRPSKSLGDSRMCMSRELNQRAQQLWRLITEGEQSQSEHVQDTPASADRGDLCLSLL